MVGIREAYETKAPMMLSVEEEQRSKPGHLPTLVLWRPLTRHGMERSPHEMPSWYRQHGFPNLQNHNQMNF